MINSFFLEIDHRHSSKSGQNACGDFFLSKRFENGSRVVSVLADGLGSGIKASVLATLSSTMALRFISNDISIYKTAQLIMETLPVCQVRKIGYSTFTIIDIDMNGSTRIIEYDNPPFVLVRNGKSHHIDRNELLMKDVNGRDISLFYSEFQTIPNDRIVFYSDGVTQAGIGSHSLPLGWGDRGATEFIENAIFHEKDISAGELSRRVISRARFIDGGESLDDTSCAVIFLRRPRKLNVFSGAPYAEGGDDLLASYARKDGVRKAICGGTTATIIARELGRELVLDQMDVTDMPPCSKMEGFDLVTEGMITLSRAVTILEYAQWAPDEPANGAERLVSELLDNDEITFYIGTKINAAHQNPSMGVELDFRRNVIKKMATLLESRFLKKTSIIYL